METLVQDVRYATRLLRRSPSFAVMAMLTLAVAIGANAAIFSAVQGILRAPPPSSAGWCGSPSECFD